MEKIYYLPEFPQFEGENSERDSKVIVFTFNKTFDHLKAVGDAIDILRGQADYLYSWAGFMEKIQSMDIDIEIEDDGPDDGDELVYVNLPKRNISRYGFLTKTQNNMNRVMLMLPDSVLINLDEYISIYQHNFGPVKQFIPRITNKGNKNYFEIIPLKPKYELP